MITVIDPEDLKLRPIVAGPACPTHRLSHLLDILLRPFLVHVKSHIKNNLEFLNKLPSKLGATEVLVTLDIVSLYSNIEHNLGLTAIQYYVQEFPELLGRFPGQLILDGCKLILENNYFEFNGNYFLQIQGTAMGTKFAPTYAILVLGYLEQRVYDGIKNNFNENILNKFIQNFMRYIDDIFIIWDTAHGSIDFLLNQFNSLNPQLSFTSDQIGKEVEFLDVNVKAINGKLVTDINYKITDTRQYLQYDSNHPRHTKNNVPFNLARRICTIVTDEFLREKRLAELRYYLYLCKYPENVIHNGIIKAKSIPVSELRSPRDHDDTTDVLPFIISHNPNYNNNYSCVKSSFDLLRTAPCTASIFANAKLIKANRQPSNLKRILSRAKFDICTEHTVSKC